MDVFLTFFLGKDYERKINYNKDIKKLNNILDKILYFCNNINYKRIKNLYINIIENYDYKNEDDFSNFDKVLIDTNDSDAYIKRNNKEINKEIGNFNKEYIKFIGLDYHKKKKIKNVEEQNKYLINKLKNIISKLNIHDDNEEKEEKEEDENINFNIILINDKSSLYLLYNILKKGLFKNLHCIESNESTSEDGEDGENGENEENEEDNHLIKINKELRDIYDKTFDNKLEELKKNIEELKKNIKILKKNIEEYNKIIEDYNKNIETNKEEEEEEEEE